MRTTHSELACLHHSLLRRCASAPRACIFMPAARCSFVAGDHTQLAILTANPPESPAAAAARDLLLEQLQLDFAAVAAAPIAQRSLSGTQNVMAHDPAVDSQWLPISEICSVIPRAGSSLARHANWVEMAAAQLQITVTSAVECIFLVSHAYVPSAWLRSTNTTSGCRT